MSAILGRSALFAAARIKSESDYQKLLTDSFFDPSGTEAAVHASLHLRNAIMLPSVIGHL